MKALVVASGPVSLDSVEDLGQKESFVHGEHLEPDVVDLGNAAGGLVNDHPHAEILDGLEAHEPSIPPCDVCEGSGWYERETDSAPVVCWSCEEGGALRKRIYANER